MISLLPFYGKRLFLLPLLPALAMIVIFSGCGGRSFEETVMPLLPGVPTILEVKNITNTTVDISWYKTAGAERYKVYKDAKLYKAFVYGTSLQITGLTAGAEYVMQVSSENQKGESSLSAPVRVRTTSVILPAAPANLRAGGISSIGFTLSWDAVSGVSGYKVYKDGALLADTTATSVPVTGLSPTTSYAMSVSGVNQHGEGPKSLLTVTTTDIPPEPPPVPTGLAASSVTSSSFNLKWSKVDVAKSYKVFLNGNQHVSGYLFTNLTITGLSPSTLYSAQVSSVNDFGESDKSTALPVTTLMSAPTGLAASLVTDTSFTLSWDSLDGADSYSVYKDGVILFSSVTSTSKSVTGLSAGTKYTMAVCGVKGGVEGGKSSLDVTTVPGAPANLSASEITGGSFKLAWDTVTGAASYQVYLDDTLKDSGIIAPPHTVTGLSSSTQYRVEVSAVNSAGMEGIKSQVLIVTTADNSAPVASNLTTIGDKGNIIITYDLSDSEGEACSIKFFYSTDGGASYTQTANLTGTTAGITPGTGKTIVWTSASDISGNEPNVKVKIQPNDGIQDGTAGESAAFAIDNSNRPPVASNLTTIGNKGNIIVTYDLTDAEGEACSIKFFYSTDGGASYTQTANLTGTTAGITPGTGKTIVWTSASDIAGNEPNVTVQILPNDGNQDGTAGESAVFAIDNSNQVPAVSNVTTAGSKDNISVTYDLADADGEACSVKFEYSKDGGASYIETSSLTGATSGIIPGTGKTITWKSFDDIKINESNVKIRLTPNDGVQNG
ncbi:MAG: fibronectin type III domain-containing protein, partial [Candidatus Wallbacteria bacterium]|nr:fibronectin type III domain-containing protein [Candidatus Wallbacteria bacterium]